MITAVLVGLGHRGVGYATYADSHPGELQIVGVAEPDPMRRKRYAKRFGVSAENCFENAEDLAAAERFADVAINGTMDEIHVETTVPLLEAGYDVLLEKPIAPNEKQLKIRIIHEKKMNILNQLQEKNNRRECVISSTTTKE